MNHTQPVTTTPNHDLDPNRAPRTMTHEQMRPHQTDGTAVLLTERERHRTLIRYDNVWWIADEDGYLEITSPSHNAKLDQWHRRLTDGALWS
jgi:hypothetical protein